MGTHRVKLDAETEKSLARLRKATGLSVSEVLTLGIEACAKQLPARPYEVYRRLDLGAGGWSRAPAAQVKQAVRKAVRHKLQG
jgi:hypothetical protein